MSNDASKPLPAKPGSATIESDDPIVDKSADSFNRAGFAEYLASVINDLPRHQGLGQSGVVIAVFGSWGSGKTSVKNMALTSTSIDINPTVVEFSPWQFESTEQLIREFFSALANGAFPSKDGEKARLKRAKMMGYAARIAKIGGLAVGAVLPLGGDLVKELFKNADKGIEKLSKVLDEGSKGLAEHAASSCLSDVRQALAKDLSELERPLLVVIDDIDRLEHSEARLLMQLLKANANLPNVHYLILASRSHLQAALTYDGNDGAEFVEKIVTASVDLPTADAGASKDYLETKLRPITERWRGTFLLDDSPLMSWVDHVFPVLLRTPRAAKRFCNGLRLYLGALSDGGELHADILDAIAIELIRQFFPEQYQAILGLKDQLTTTQFQRYVDADEVPAEDVVNPLVRELGDPWSSSSYDLILKSGKTVSQAEHERAFALTTLLNWLFPFVDWVERKFVVFDDDSLMAHRRLCHPYYWPIYFQQNPAAAPFSEAAWSQLRAGAYTVKDFNAFFSSMIRKPEFGINLVGLRLKEVPVDKQLEFIIGLFLWADTQPYQPRSPILGHTIKEAAASTLTHSLLLQPGIDERKDFVEQLLGSVPSHGALAAWSRGLRTSTEQVPAGLAESEKDDYVQRVNDRIAESWNSRALLNEVDALTPLRTLLQEHRGDVTVLGDEKLTEVDTVRFLEKVIEPSLGARGLRRREDPLDPIIRQVLSTAVLEPITQLNDERLAGAARRCLESLQALLTPAVDPVPPTPTPVHQES